MCVCVFVVWSDEFFFLVSRDYDYTHTNQQCIHFVIIEKFFFSTCSPFTYKHTIETFVWLFFSFILLLSVLPTVHVWFWFCFFYSFEKKIHYHFIFHTNTHTVFWLAHVKKFENFFPSKIWTTNHHHPLMQKL